MIETGSPAILNTPKRETKINECSLAVCCSRNGRSCFIFLLTTYFICSYNNHYLCVLKVGITTLKGVSLRLSRLI